MAAERQKLQEALCSYTSDTLAYFATVRDFCERSSDWKSDRETELNLIKDIKERADKINLNFKHVVRSVTAVAEYVSSKVNVDGSQEELEEELASVLKETLRGLEKLSCFLDALEKLAVTSLYVFMENQVLHLPKWINLDDVQVVIKNATEVCPLLLKFKRDANVFFLPKLQNVGVLLYQLDKYIQTTQEILDELKESSLSEFDPKMNMKMVVELDVDLSKDDVQRMFSHIDQLDKIRKDRDFRMVFLFQEEETCSDFIRKFNEHKPKMLQSLEELEDSCVQFDRMSEKANISIAAGCSVGAVGGALSIAGFALAPSPALLRLIIGGSLMGATRAGISAVTTVTKTEVNCMFRLKASEVLQNFVDDVQVLQGFLEWVSRRKTSCTTVIKGVGEMCWKVRDIYREGAVDAFSAFRMIRIEDVIAGQAALKEPLALSKALFAGMDIFFCEDSIRLAKGNETEFLQFIRVRAALWSSEIESWQKIHDSLSKGRRMSLDNKIVLQRSFYPEIKKKKQRDMKFLSMQVLKKPNVMALNLCGFFLLLLIPFFLSLFIQ